MAGDGGPGPAQSIEGRAEGPGVPSEARDEQPGASAQEATPGREGAVTPEGTPGPDSSPAEEAPSQPDEALSQPEEAASEPEEAPSEPEAMRQAAFMGVALELPSIHPSVVLQEIDAPMRELRVTIAQPEGVAIAYAWRGIATPRPLTHDLLTTIFQRFDLQVDSVRIIGVDGPVFHAELALSGPSGSHTVACRPSDALALALRQPLPVPIMVAEEVLVTAGHIPGA
jgi:hypothetical protein